MRTPCWPRANAAASSLSFNLLAGERECERSSLVNEEIVYFIFQLELDAQLQRALNYEAYEAAQQIRAKRETVGGPDAAQGPISRHAASCACVNQQAGDTWYALERAAPGPCQLLHCWLTTSGLGGRQITQAEMEPCSSRVNPP